jgi:hypothetical protein
VIVFNLACENAHPFEGWFGSAGDFQSQQARGLLSCPMCGSENIEKKLHAPRLNFGASAPTSAPTSSSSDTSSAVASNEKTSPSTEVAVAAPAPADALANDSRSDMLRAMLKHIADNTEDVGRSFAEEARKIHYNEAPARSIRGVASREDAQALADEGIEVAQLPFPVMPEKLLN